MPDEATRVLAPLAPLLADSALGLTLVAGRADVGYAAVRRPPRPADRPWLAAHDLRVVVAGEEGHDELLRHGPAVLVYALTPAQRHLPEHLAGRAAAKGFTLLSAPPSVAPDLIEVAALRGLVGAAGPAGAALASPQAYLAAAMASPKPERDLLERLFALTGTDLVLVSPWGEVAARAGTGGWRPGGAPVATWREGNVRLGGRAAILLRLEAAGRPGGVLLAFEPPEWARPLLELTRTLLCAAAAVRAATAREQAAAGGELLAAWLALPEAAAKLAPRLARFGFEDGAPYQFGVAAAAARPVGLQAAGEEYFQQRGVPVLALAEGATITWAFGAPGAGRAPGPGREGAALGRALAAAQQGARLGLSGTHTRLADAGAALRQAELALADAPAGGGVASFDDLDPLTWLQGPGGALEALRERLLGPLVAADPHGKLLATLTAYLEAPADQAALARRLGVHVNTLRYRLRRIEELIGAPLSSPETLARLWLATRPAAGGTTAGGPAAGGSMPGDPAVGGRPAL